LAKLKPFDLTISDHALQAAIWLMVGVGRLHQGREERAGDGDQGPQISRRGGEHQ
jgi:hypothetical protein